MPTALETIVRDAYRTGPDDLDYRTLTGHPVWLLYLGDEELAIGYDEQGGPIEDPDDETVAMINWTSYHRDAGFLEVATEGGGTLAEARAAVAAWIESADQDA